MSVDGDVLSLEIEDMSFLDEVPKRDRDILVQRIVHGSTSAEIASDLGIPAATVRSRIHLALRRLRRQMRREHMA